MDCFLKDTVLSCQLLLWGPGNMKLDFLFLHKLRISPKKWRLQLFFWKFQNVINKHSHFELSFDNAKIVKRLFKIKQKMHNG